jgi:hypothetical protein
MFGNDRVVACFCLIALCLLLGSGRMSSFDGSSQLAAAVHFCATGHIGSNQQVDHDFAPKDFKGNSGTWYDSNDIGSTLVVLPAACAAVLSGAHDPATLGNLTTYAKTGASLTFALLGGIGVMFVFLALTELIESPSRAWWWSLAFLFGTGYLAYLKGVWSVLPSATAIAGLAWIVTRALAHRDSPARTVYWAAAAVGLASLSRYTLLPFLTIGTVAVLLPTLKALPRRHLVGASLLLFVLVLPSFAYNQLRTGRFWVPGQSAPQFHSTDALHVSVSYWLSTTQMFFGFSHGLLYFAPICLLGYFGALVFIFRSSGQQRLAWIVGLLSVVAYTIVVSLLHRWQANFGWGPRYLVPFLPVLFLVGVMTVERRIVPRLLGYALVALGLVTQIPLVFANWSALVAVVGQSGVPNPIFGLWHSALHGIAHGTGIGTVVEAEALQVPDVWWWHAVAGDLPHVVGLLVLLGGFAAILWLASYPTGVSSRASRAPRPAENA